jgi:hypothetical protein
MPVLSNPRYERFAQGIAKGMSQIDAYNYAGYQPNQERKDIASSASAVARTPQVAARIKDLLERQAKRVGISVDDLLVELNAMYQLAMRTKQPASGVGAVIAKAKLLGLMVDRVETDVNIRKPARSPTEDKTMSLDEWREKFTPKDTSKDQLQ